MKRIKHLFLSVMMLSSALLATGCQQGLPEDQIPDYSGYDHQFEFFGYHSAHDGWYTIDKVPYYTGESFLTEEQYQLYKDVGMTMFYPQSIFRIPDEESAAQRGEPNREESWAFARAEIDKLVSIGMDRTVLYDEELSWLGLNEPIRVEDDGLTDGQREAEGLIGEADDQFDTTEDLDAEVERLLSLYADYPGVYGVCLADEPKNVWYKSYGDLYNSIKRVSEKNGWDLYISFNLNPLNLTKDVYQQFYPYVEGTNQNPDTTGHFSFEDGFVRYKQYIENFLSSMQPDYIRYDDYPLRNGKLRETYIPNLQYIADVCRDRGLEFHMVTQSFGMNSQGTQSMRQLTEEGAKWLNNMLLGFGVTEISYFTYFTRTENVSTGESFYQYDNGSFVSMYGKPTNIYYFMKEIMADNQRFAPTVLQFKYKKSGVFINAAPNYSTAHLRYVENVNKTTYEKLKSVSINKECAMVNEMYDAENDRYMYMAMNIVDPMYQGSLVYQTITLEFAPEYKYAVVYRDGERTLHKLKGSKLNVKCAPGEASFVIPF